jgi:hypothetical protein
VQTAASFLNGKTAVDFSLHLHNREGSPHSSPAFLFAYDNPAARLYSTAILFLPD